MMTCGHKFDNSEKTKTLAHDDM